MMKKYATFFFLGMTALAPLASYAGMQAADTSNRKVPVPQNLPAPGGVLPLRDTVPVLFGTQPGARLLQSYGIVYNDALRNIPVTSVENALYGKLAGLSLSQFSLAPGEDGAATSLRGASPMVVVDGVPRPITSIDPEQIASVSILRDALATAMYGTRGANGVILIQTKHGFNGKKRISFTAQTAIQQMLETPEFLGAYDYARLYNEALVNDGRQPVYTQGDLDAWKNGSDPYGHPDVDWYDKVLNKQAGMQRYNLNISGGNRISRYFVDLDYLNQKGYFVTDPGNTYETNNFYKRFGFRSNVDVELTRSTFLSLSLAGRIRSGNEPGAGTAAIYSQILSTPNNAYPVTNFDGSLGGNNDYQRNIYGQAVRSGYRPSYNRNLMADLSVMQRLDSWLPGLYAKGTLSLNAYYDESLNRSKSFAVYNVIARPGEDTLINKIGTDGQQSNSSSIVSDYRQAYTEFMLGYDSTFGAHHIGAAVVGFRDSYTSARDLPLVNAAVSLRANYDYAGKYLLEFVMARSYNNMYHPDHRWGYFPAAGIGWNIAREDWFRSALPAIGILKLRASYGVTGNSADAGYYRYIQYYNNAASYNFGNPSTSATTITEGALANPGLTWEKSGKLNIGVDVAALDDRLEFSAEYFKNRNTGLLMVRGDNASGIIGNTLPLENIGESVYKGLELTAGYRGQAGALNYYIKGNLSFVQSRVEEMKEVRRAYDWNRRTGQPVNMLFGYVADGFYQSADEIQKGPAPEGYSPVPGDIRYRDLNGDGIINLLDERPIYDDRPFFFYGLTAGISWKGLDLGMTWQGVGNRSVYLSGSNVWEFLNTSQNAGPGQAQVTHLGRWTPETAATATYPRLTVNGNVNNHRPSTFWVKDGSYLRLKNLELGYTLPQRWVSHLKLASIRAFASGYNLLTFSPLENMDPEALFNGYPNQRIINFGVNIQL